MVLRTYLTFLRFAGLIENIKKCLRDISNSFALVFQNQFLIMTNIDNDRRRAPIDETPIQTNFPDCTTIKLDNGLSVICFEQPDSPLATVKLYARAGSVLDGNSIRVSSFMFALLQQGTASRTAQQIAEEVEFYGADLTTGSSMDFGTISLSTLSKHLSNGLELLCDIALNPSFLQQELEFVREQSLSRLKFSRADATRLSSETFNREIYSPHPYGNPPLGTEDSIQKLSREDIQKFYQTYFLPSRSFITVSGDIDASLIANRLNEGLASWKAMPSQEPRFDFPKMSSEKRVLVVQKDDAVQSIVNIGHASVARNHPEYARLYTLNMILGGYFGSRLNMNLREKQGFTYGIRSGFDALKLGGDFNISTQVRNEVTGEAIRQILLEVERLCNEGVTEKELKAVKQYIAGNFVIQNESPNAIANRFATIELYDLPPAYFKTYIDDIQSVTRKDILDAAQRHIRPDSFVFVIAGDSKSVIKQVEKFGRTVVQDAEGNPLSL